jgi:hypothetical protein
MPEWMRRFATCWNRAELGEGKLNADTVRTLIKEETALSPAHCSRRGAGFAGGVR